MARIVSIAHCVPHPGIPHAGGEYYRRHADVLAAEHEVTVVAPSTTVNREAVAALEAAGGAAYDCYLVPARHTPLSRATAPLRRQLVRALPFLLRQRFHTTLMQDERARALLRAADVVELQWFEEAVAVSAVRRAVPGTPVVAVIHDVVSQKLRREAAGARGLGRAGAATRAGRALRWAAGAAVERRVLSRVDAALALSEKDAALLRARHPRSSAKVVAVTPPLDEPGMPSTPPDLAARPQRALLVGAFFRHENEDAAMWLMQEVWPLVLDRVPGAELVLAGAAPTDRMTAAASALPAVTVTGYVDSLAEHYASARVAVSPVRQGAGVKLKSITPMLWGVPVVVTPLGGEGIDGDGVFTAVDDTAAGLADALAAVLADPATAAPAVARAHAWSHGTASAAAYARALPAVYAGR